MDQYDERLKRIEAELAFIHMSVEKTRKYFFYTLIGTAVVVILPLIGLFFAVPTFLSSYTSLLGL